MESPPPSARIEIGWVLTGELEAVDAQAVRAARTRMLHFLRERFAAFDWRMPVVRRPEAALNRPAEPVNLLDIGVAERDAGTWDFAFVVTAHPLKSYFKRYAFGTPSRAMQVAALSTARIDPAAVRGDATDEERVEVLSQRVFALALHLFGHLCDAEHDSNPADVMYKPAAAADLDAMRALSDEAQAVIRRELEDVADVRLEETGLYRGQALLFYLRAMWMGRRDILRAVANIRPWQFPLRFSKLTTAATSTMVILIITAEAWDLGMSQPPLFVTLLSITALGGTSYYILKQQQLVGRRRTARLSEQRVVGNVSIVAGVALGMTTMYALLFGVTFALSRTLFSQALVEGWAASLGGQIAYDNYLILAAFVAALGLIIGGLGASFEEQGYFRHVAYVDEET